MKNPTGLIAVLAIAALTLLAAPLTEVDQMKADLIGQTMGGREKSWKFQSPDQIKQLVIKSRVEDGRRQVCFLSMKLQATNSTERYAAEAKVEYWRTPSGWKVDHVGLLSLQKIE
ncbi:MAG TPA: hypothetical protein VK850_08715 [Candidatus Binatia bacterium]|nr:hypothetical protein [Candidatus Binatia bacterium]